MIRKKKESGDHFLSFFLLALPICHTGDEVAVIKFFSIYSGSKSGAA
jgi:hypothetical protein